MGQTVGAQPRQRWPTPHQTRIAAPEAGQLRYDPKLFPKPLKGQCQTDPPYTENLQIPADVRLLHLHAFGEPSQRADQRIHLPLGMKSIQSSQGGDDALMSATVFPAVLHQLQVFISSSASDSDEHRLPLTSE